MGTLIDRQSTFFSWGVLVSLLALAFAIGWWGSRVETALTQLQVDVAELRVEVRESK